MIMSNKAASSRTSVHIAHQLKKLSLFSELSDSTISHFAEKASLYQRDKGTLLFLQEEEIQWFYVIIGGWVKIFRENSDSSEAVLDIVSHGFVLGVDSIADYDFYTYSAELIDETHYIKLPASLLKYYLEKDHLMARNLLAYLSQQNRRKNREIEHLNLQNASQRIGCFLLRHCSSSNKDTITTLRLPYDKSSIAARLGMQPETFSRAFARLKQQVDINMNGSIASIPDKAALENYVCASCSSGLNRQ